MQNSMSDTTLVAVGKIPDLADPEGIRDDQGSSGRMVSGRVQKVWCAPMSDDGEWVVTWTGVAGARGYELQTSLDCRQWSNDSKFSGTRAVLILGPAERCWVRVRAVSAGGAGPWSPPARGVKETCASES